jgi:hypothetical protein
MVGDAREQVLADSDRPAEQALDEAIAEQLTTHGYRISASRVRTYLAELRAADSPARRPRVLTSGPAPAAAAEEA